MPEKKAPAEIACGKKLTVNFKKGGHTDWRKTSWDAGTLAEDLVETFSKATEAAAKEWAKDVQCTGNCPGAAPCSKGKVIIGPVDVNGDRNTWPPEYKDDYSECRIYVEVTCRAVVPCYCGKNNEIYEKSEIDVHVTDAKVQESGTRSK